MEGRLLPLVATIVAFVGCALAASSSVMPTSVVTPSHNPSVSPSSSPHPQPSTSSSLSPSPSPSTSTSSSLSPSPSPSTSTSSSPSPSPPSTSTPSSPPPSPSSTSIPAPSPTPGPPNFPDESYYVYKNGDVCVHLKASIETSVIYRMDNGANSTIFNVSGNADVDNTSSWCNDSSAGLVLSWEYESQEKFNLTFLFKTTPGGVTWTEGGVIFQYPLNNTLFPDYSGNSSRGFAIFGDLLEGQASNIEQQRSFLCNDSLTLNSTDTSTYNTTNATLTVKNFQMQAFYFRNATTGDFDNARNCNGGPTNAIVPIVVGAALGGLVVVVLVAYLVGRIKNRRQSSYQALS